jgi:hypothetical protein
MRNTRKTAKGINMTEYVIFQRCRGWTRDAANILKFSDNICTIPSII